MDVELTSEGWVMTIPPAPNYSVREAAWILCAGRAWVASLEGLLGPASSPARPVDHDALVQYVLVRARKRKRAKARAQLKLLLEHHLGD